MTALPSTVAFYLSEDDVLDEDDAFLGYESVKTLELAGEELVPLNLLSIIGSMGRRIRRDVGAPRASA